jgi:hypothetical protein
MAISSSIWINVPPPATGTIVQEGTGSDLLKSDMIRRAYLGM